MHCLPDRLHNRRPLHWTRQKQYALGQHSPFSLGRNFDELYGGMIALQTADAFSVATSADWRPGDEAIVPPAGSCGVAKDRMEGKEDMKCYDWFFCTKKLSEQEVLGRFLKKSASSLDNRGA